MRRIRLGTLLALLGAGCAALFPADDDSATGGQPPRILSSSPSGVVVVPACGSVQFTARGEDAASLDLTWTFLLDGGLEATGEEDDGDFEVGWELGWDASRAGEEAEVELVVSDGQFDTRLYWPVDFGADSPCR